MWVPSLVWEDPLEKGMATLSSILPEESHTWCTTVDCCKRLKQLSMWKTQGKSYTNYTKELDKEVKVC